MPNSKPLILFDIDDTLINHTEAEMIASGKFGVSHHERIPYYSAEAFPQIWHNTAKTHIADFLKGEISFQEQRRRRIRDVFQAPELTDKEADELFMMYLKFYEASWRLFDDVLKFFNAPNSTDFAVLSDGSQQQQEKKLKTTGIRHHFKFVITAESEGFSKPDPKFFLRACRIAGKPPSDVFYIGDNLEKDATGASRAGLRGVWLNRIQSNRVTEIDSVTTLDELHSIVKT